MQRIKKFYNVIINILNNGRATFLVMGEVALFFNLLIDNICQVYLLSIFQNIYWQMAYNVTGIRRSSPPYKALRSNAVGWNVGERKPHKGRIARLRFFEPRAAEQAAQRIPFVIRYSVLF